jgi:hypothetical protein
MRYAQDPATGWPPGMIFISYASFEASSVFGTIEALTMSQPVEKPLPQRDGADSRSAPEGKLDAARWGIDLRDNQFNVLFFKATAADRETTVGTSPGDRTRAPEARNVPLAGSDGPTGRVTNVDASKKFEDRALQSIRNSISKLKPEYQAKLNGLNVFIASTISKVIPDTDPRDEGAVVTPRPGDKPANSIIFSERKANQAYAPLQDITNHEIAHPLDNIVNASGDPAFRALLDQGLQQMPKKFSDRYTGPGAFGGSKDDMYKELFADLFASVQGTRSEHLGPLAGQIDRLDPQHKIRNWIRDKFFQK